MSAALFAAAVGWTFAELLIAIVIIAAVVAVVVVALNHFGVAIPPVVIKIFWICLVAALAVLAIRFLLSL
jgi:hypothetical protein